MKLRKVLLSATVAALPVNVLALGLGNAQLSSALNEPLQARIDLYSVRSSELEDIKAELASVADFQKAGLEWSSNLSQLRFNVSTGPDGKPYISVTSQKPVREPFLNFLLEVNWPTGRLLREYTVLLDPPVYADAMKTTVQPTVTADAGAAAASRAPQRAPASATTPPPSGASGMVRDGRYGPVQRSETLWSIASAVRPDVGVSVQQAMLALVDANPDAFIAGNVNALKEGQVLRIPGREEMTARTQREALAEVKRQYARWQQQRLEGTAGLAPAGDTRQAGSGQAGAAGSTVDEDARLELVSPGRGEQGAGAGGDDALRESLMLAEEELDSAKAENAEIKSRLAETEAMLEDFERLLQLKNENIAELQRRLRQEQFDASGAEPEEVAEPEVAPPSFDDPAFTEEPLPLEDLLGPMDEPAAGDEAGEPGMGPDEGETAAAVTEEPAGEAVAESPIVEEPVAQQPAPAAEPATPPKRAPILPPPPASEPAGPLDSLPVSPAILGAGLGGILLLLLGGLFLRKKRAAGESPESEEPQAEVTPVTPPPAAVEPPPAQDTESTAAFAAEESTKDEQTSPEAFSDTLVQEAASRDDDALDEVNVYLAYERYDQAEQLVRKAIAADPEREAYHLKLLEIHHTAKNTEGFRKDAAALQALVGAGAPAMVQAMTWWEELAPDSPLFGDSDEMEGGATPGSAEADDLDSEFEKTLEGEQADMAGSPGDLDFDLSGDETAQAAAEGVAAGDQADDMELDFDLGLEEGEDEVVTGERAMEGLDLEFDEETEKAGQTTGDEVLDLDFDLGEGDETSGTGGGLDLDLSDASGKEDDGAAGAGMELDFDLGEGDEDKAEGGLDFDLGLGDEEPAPPASSGVPEVGRSEGSGEPQTPAGDEGMGLDFDLGEVDEEQASTAERPAAGGEAGTPEDSGLDFDLDTGEDIAGAGGKAGEADSGRLDTVALDNLDMDLDAGTEADKPAAEGGGLDLDLGTGGGDTATPSESGEGEEDLDFDFSDFDLPEDDAAKSDTGEGITAQRPDDEGPEIDFDLDLGFDEDEEPAQTLGLGGEMGGEPDEVGTKLDLAQAYIDMGNADGARTILSEVLSEGDEAQKTEAQALLDKLD